MVCPDNICTFDKQDYCMEQVDSFDLFDRIPLHCTLTPYKLEYFFKLDKFCLRKR